MDSLGISVSGMNAASKRLDAAASNTANRLTEDFDRREVEQSARADGGVDARIVTSAQPNNSDEAFVADAVQTRVAQREFEANASAFRARQDAIGKLFDGKA